MPPSSDSLLEFLLDLGYKGQLRHISIMYVDQMHQPWRTFRAFINRCLSGKTLRNDRLRPSRIGIFLQDILWHIHWFKSSKKGRGKGAHETKATVIPKKTSTASKKKQSKRKMILHDESDESQGEPKNRPTGRKKRSPRAIVIQEPLSVHVKKTYESSRKIKEVSDELTRKFAESNEGSDEKPEDIPWQSTNDDESENDDEEDESDDDKKEENTKRVEEQKDDEELKAEEEQKGDDQAGDEQLVIHASTTQRETPIKEALEKTLPYFGQSSFQGQSAIKAVKSLSEYDLKKILYAKMHKIQSNLTHEMHQELFNALTWLMLLDETNIEKGDKPDTVLKKRDRRDDQDEDPSAGSNQGKKTKKRRVNESELSKKTSTTNESSKALDDVEKTVDKVGDAGQPPHTDVDETQADADSKILNKDWFKNDPQHETLDLDWNTIKTIEDALE
uniref:Uncharacterized protein n=1 Tax=Tanacetum cinerariifolium TaxID=118510 RepID=A0A6L2KZP2_TANCI|nr:hypothetical protein [Tanacetum cinerariifolium]